MSRTRPAKFAATNSSTSSWLPAMPASKLVGLRSELHRPREHRVVAVPLDEVGAAHERAVLRRAAVVVPEIEIDEVDRLAERRRRQRALFAQRGHQAPGLLYFLVRARDHLLGLRVH